MDVRGGPPVYLADDRYHRYPIDRLDTDLHVPALNSKSALRALPAIRSAESSRMLRRTSVRTSGAVSPLPPGPSDRAGPDAPSDTPRRARVAGPLDAAAPHPAA